jgi:hypothetical protein
MQNAGCAVEFAPAESFAFGSCDINNLSIRKVIRAYFAMMDGARFQLGCKSNANTGS